MKHSRSNSLPNLVRPSAAPTEKQYDDSALQGVAANIKLLLKLIQDHKSETDKEKNDRRRMLRVSTMITILDNVRERILKSQSFGNITSSSGPELDCGYTDLKPHNLPKDKKSHREDTATAMAIGEDDEKEKMRKQLSASLAARKSLQAVCSTLGKEKAIMGAELLKKVHELGETEDLVNYLKEQNQNLRGKVQECVFKHKEKKDSEVIAALQEHNRAVSGQLLTSLDEHRVMKKKIKLVEEENALVRGTVDEMDAKVTRSLERVRSFNERTTGSPESTVDVREEIVELESMFESFQILVEKHKKKQGECSQLKAEISACKPSVVA